MDQHAVYTHYATQARHYDLFMRPFAHIRTQAIRQLDPRPGDCVVELGCGTGTSFPELVARLGPTGQLIGVDRSRAMLGYAAQKVWAAGWTQVLLVHADADQLALRPHAVDALLAFYTHDIFTSVAAIQQAVQVLRPHGRVVIAGAKLTAHLPGRLLNPITRRYARQSIRRPLTTRPWQQLEQQLGMLQVTEYLGGSAFLADGTKAREPS